MDQKRQTGGCKRKHAICSDGHVDGGVHRKRARLSWYDFVAAVTRIQARARGRTMRRPYEARRPKLQCFINDADIGLALPLSADEPDADTPTPDGAEGAVLDELELHAIAAGTARVDDATAAAVMASIAHRRHGRTADDDLVLRVLCNLLSRDRALPAQLPGAPSAVLARAGSGSERVALLALRHWCRLGGALGEAEARGALALCARCAAAREQALHHHAAACAAALACAHYTSSALLRALLAVPPRDWSCGAIEALAHYAPRQAFLPLLLAPLARAVRDAPAGEAARYVPPLAALAGEYAHLRTLRTGRGGGRVTFLRNVMNTWRPYAAALLLLPLHSGAPVVGH
eukprot:g4861.t1